MTRKELLKSDILLKMKNHLDKTVLSILDVVLSEALYHVDIVEAETLPATQDMTNEYILERFELDNGINLSEESMKAYKCTYREFMRYIPKSLLTVTKEDVEHYLRKKAQEGNKSSSLNNKRRKMRSLFTWMCNVNLIVKNPATPIKQFKEILAPIDHLEPEEVEQLKTGCKTKRDRAMLEWLRSTALRKGEAVSVNINQINWMTGQVMIYGSKGHAYRMVCLDAVALKYIQEYIEERGLDIRSNQPLMAYEKGGHVYALSKNGLYAAIRRIGERSGLQRRVYPHLFRKTTATNIVKRGGSDSDAGEYLGHKPNGVAARHYTFRGQEHVVKIFQNFVAAV